MAQFIKLTANDGAEIRFNVDHISQYENDPEAGGGSLITTNLVSHTSVNPENGGTDYYYQEVPVAETVGYIDELLGTLDPNVKD